MQIIVNGEKKEISPNTTIKELITMLQIEDKVMAAAVNMQVVKKENWPNYIIKENDKIELLHFVGGG